MIDRNQESKSADPAEFTDPQLASIRDEHSTLEMSERFIAFYFAENLYCIRADLVAEVIHSPAVAALPNSPRGVLGIAAVRGEVIAVLSLKNLLKVQGGVSRISSKMIVLKPRENQTQ